MDTKKLADLLFPKPLPAVEEIEAKYPPRALSKGAVVTRFAPSPTGFMHLGNLYGALIDERLAHQSGGIFYLRIEDTDKKREVEGAVDFILSGLGDFGITFDEGVTIDGENGAYGPYRQSLRAEIYQAYAKKLVTEGKAYPCFCTEEDLAEMRQKQEAQKANFGYYGQWAKHRDMPFEEIKEKIEAGTPYVLRFRSTGNPEKTVEFDDLVRGRLTFPENDQDYVLLKSDGIPTYHFAHVIDDHLMGTTHVVRGDEWLATLPVHVQFFEALGFRRPQYIHTPALMKTDGGGKRKLSKRKDPEAALSYYKAQGYPKEALLEYLMTLLNSNYEEWRMKNPDAPYTEFAFKAKKMPSSGALFDLAKLRDVSKNIIAKMDAQEVTEKITAWAKEFDEGFHALLARDADYARRIFAIGRGVPKPRKDLAAFSEAKDYASFFYDELFCPVYEYPEKISKDDVNEILSRYQSLYDPADDNEAWFSKIGQLSEDLGFAPQTKLYKKNPEGYKGHVGDVSAVLRMAVTGRQNSPDLWEVMQILGKSTVCERLEKGME